MSKRALICRFDGTTNSGDARTMLPHGSTGRKTHAAHSGVSRLIVPLFLLFLCWWIPTWVAADQKPNLYAVVVGVTQFQDPKVPALTLSSKDASDFHGFLKEREKLFGKADLTLLVNEKATRANITAAVRNRLKGAGKDDVVMIYLSGHGVIDPGMANEFYFVTHDAKTDNLFGTALLMNDQNLFKGIASERCLLLTDACHSGGFNVGLGKGTAKSFDPVFGLFHGIRGRIGISSSRPDELSYEKPMFGNSVFTHFLLKGLRGEAARGSSDGIVTANKLYEFVSKSTRDATANQQTPQLYTSGEASLDAPVFVVPTYSSPLKLKVQFQYEDDAGRTAPLEDNAALKSGQYVGITFRPESDCFVYIFWWDSSGNVGRLFPNPNLTEGTGEVKAGKTYWLPSMDGERWYILDDQPGEETIYVIASRTRNSKIEDLYEKLRNMSASARGSKQGRKVEGELARQVNLMGFADRTTAKQAVGKAASNDRKSLFESVDSEIKVTGADSVYGVKFKHVKR